MDLLNQKQIADLIGHDGKLCVSLFMPTHATGTERQQDAIRLKNLVARAEEELLSHDLRRSDAQALLAPAAALPEEAFWRHRSEGLACFAAHEFFQAYRVPIALEELLIVDRRFHVTPVVPLLGSDARFYVLALSQEEVRLYEATRYSIRELTLPEIERAPLDGDNENLQYHSHQAPSRGRGETAEAIYHGHGGPTDRAKTDILNHFHRVDRAVTDALRDAQAPLVLACVGYLAPIYESANTYKHLVESHVTGSPERGSPEELREQAWAIVEPHFRKDQDAALDRLHAQIEKGRASTDLRDVVLATSDGRVDAIFLERGVRRFGHIDRAGRCVRLTEEGEGEELLDYATVHALATGSQVFALDEIPGTDSPIAATFRY